MKAELDMIDRAITEARGETDGRRLAPAVLAAIHRQGWTLEPPQRFLARPIDHTLDWEVRDTATDTRLRRFQWVDSRGRSTPQALAETYADGCLRGYEREVQP